uniref:Ig-like domain-containing protein n=1 Tax=Nothoprocta perdicaria TaxID=30464 RepID=A0A8C6ZIG6_NOTPE
PPQTLVPSSLHAASSPSSSSSPHPPPLIPVILIPSSPSSPSSSSPPHPPPQPLIPSCCFIALILLAPLVTAPSPRSGSRSVSWRCRHRRVTASRPLPPAPATSAKPNCRSREAAPALPFPPQHLVFPGAEEGLVWKSWEYSSQMSPWGASVSRRDLKNNLISTVQPGAFLGLPELKRLDLSNNRIGCLSGGVFRGLANLVRLNMSGNIFSSLQPDVFDELPSLKVVDFATEYLTCDCHLRWVLPWARNRSAQISDKTVCAYPRHVRAAPLRTGTPELHTHLLIPSLRQVVFQGDRLPFQCTATYLDNSTQIRWYHNREPVEEDERAGVIVEESLVHDCTFITSELILSNIHVSATGEWECAVSTSQGNVSKKVEIVVLETSASYCPAERVTNNRGDFR